MNPETMSETQKLTHAKGLLNATITQIANEFRLSSVVMEGLLSTILVQVKEETKMQLMAEILEKAEQEEKQQEEPALGPELTEFLGRAEKESGDKNG